MTAICILGTELSSRVQNVMILAQVGALLLFAVVALGKVYSGDATADSIEPSWSWFSPFAIDSTDALITSLLLGVFIYWGWESAVNLTEETEDSRRAPGLAARRQHRDPRRHVRRRGDGGRRLRRPRGAGGVRRRRRDLRRARR